MACTIPIPREVTIGQKYDPAMRITDQAEADEYFAALVAHSVARGCSHESAERIERDNLGYWAGYHSNDVRARVERLFKCRHPVFGTIAQDGAVTADAALMAGVRMGLGMGFKPAEVHVDR